MNQTKTELVRRIYTIVLGVFIVAMGIALICVAADIYYSGEGSGKIYTRAIVSAKLKQVAIPLLVLIATIIAGALFPLVETKTKRPIEETLKKLQRRMPASGEGEKFAEAKKSYDTIKIVRLVIWCGALALALACAIASLVYLATATNSAGGNLKNFMSGLVKTVLPCTIAALAGCIASSYTNGYLAKEQTDRLKTMIRYGSRETLLPKEIELLDTAKKIVSHESTLWTVRGMALAIGIAFVIVGILNGGATDVLAKAIGICLECIGLG